MLTKKSLLGRLATIKGDIGWGTRESALLNLRALISEIERCGVEEIPPARCEPECCRRPCCPKDR